MSVHYTNDSCPFSHRAMFARCLRPPESGKVQYVPYGRQVGFRCCRIASRFVHKFLHTAKNKHFVYKMSFPKNAITFVSKGMVKRKLN